VSDGRNSVYKKFALYEKANATGVNTGAYFNRILNPHEYHLMVKVKVKQSRYRPGVAQRAPGS